MVFDTVPFDGLVRILYVNISFSTSEADTDPLYFVSSLVVILSANATGESFIAVTVIETLDVSESVPSLLVKVNESLPL